MSGDILWALVALLALASGWFLCERTHRAHLECAKAINSIAMDSAGKILAAAQEQAGLSLAVREQQTRLDGVTASVNKLGSTIDALDMNQGAILSGLINSNIIHHSRGAHDPVGAQIGEPPPDLGAMPERTDRRTSPMSEDDTLLPV